MTAYLAGIAQTRCMEHPRAAEIDGPARAVLSAMGWLAKEQDPRCFAAHASIATRSGFGRRTVIRAQERLAELGLIERVPTGPGLPVEWRLVLLSQPAEGSLSGAEGVPESHTSPSPDLCQRVTPPTPESQTSYDSLAPNPSESYRPPGRGDGGRSDATTRPASAGAPAAAAAPSKNGPGIVAEVMAAKGCTQGAAEKWMDRKLAGATSGPVRNEDAYLRACLDQELAPAAPAKKRKGSATAKGKPAKGIPSANQRAAALSRSATRTKRPNWSVAS